MIPDEWVRTHNNSVEEISKYIATKTILTNEERWFAKLVQEYGRVQSELEKRGMKHITGTYKFVIKKDGDWNLEDPMPIQFRGEGADPLLKRAAQTDRRLRIIMSVFCRSRQAPGKWAAVRIIANINEIPTTYSIYIFNRSSFKDAVHQLVHVPFGRIENKR